MDDLKLVKQQIYEDQNIEIILRELGCEYISKEHNGQRIIAQLPPQFESNNRRSVQIKNNESLVSHIRSRGITGDIYSVIGYIQYGAISFDELTEHLYKIKKWICETLGYTQFLEFDPNRKDKVVKQDVNAWLHRLKRKRAKQIIFEENYPIPEDILKDYYMHPNMWWKREGLSLKVQQEFEVGFDLKTLRIVFAVRDKNGRLIGIKGRYVGKDKDTLEHRKYMYLYPCNKSVELFNLHRALPYIIEKKEVIIVESEKTCMFLTQYGFPNCVAICGDAITDAQIKLLKDLGIDITLTFAWDKDKDKTFILTQIGKNRILNRNVYAIFDTKDLLDKKESPLDKGREIWYRLYTKHKYKINQSGEDDDE